MSATPSIKEEEEDRMAMASSPVPTIDENETPETKDDDNDKKRRKPAPKKASEEVLQRRREGRIKAAATIAQNLKKTGIGRFEDQNAFALTSVKMIPLVNQKNYFTEYLKKDEQVTFIRNWRMRNRALAEKQKNAGETKKGDDEEDDDDDENDNDETPTQTRQGYDTIVIHPGSRYLRIGRATDPLPVTVPMVVAVPTVKKESGPYPVIPQRDLNEQEPEFSEEFENIKGVVTKDFKARMRYYKRRMMPNSRESAASFNKNQKPEAVPDNSNPDDKTFFGVDDPILKEKDYLAGEDALKLPLSENFTEWKLRWPIVNGGFNQSRADYGSPQEYLTDLVRIVMEALDAVGISKLDLPNLKCLLVIQDLYDKQMVEHWSELMLRSVGFSKVAVIQEAVAATFGAGVTCACVVDVGAQNTTVSCVDEGLVITESRVSLNYGGDNITEALTKLLLQQNFPYKSINLHNYNDDFMLADHLKKNFCTFDDADIAVQLYHFFKKSAGTGTEKFNFKVYDEVMLAPLGLFYPGLFELDGTPKERPLFPESQDTYTGEPCDPTSRAQENLLTHTGFTELTDEQLLLRLVEDRPVLKQTTAYHKTVPTQEEKLRALPIPLDKAIIESITNAGLATDFARAKKFYDNLLVVGGGLAKLPGYEVLLTDRINIWRPKFLSASTLDDILLYVGKEKDKMDAKRKQMVAEAKKKKGSSNSQEEVELTEEELLAIAEETRVTVDLERADALSEQGTLLPVNVLPAPTEFDPRETAWKGGSVYGRLKVMNEMWITQEDWNLLSTRCLNYKSLFNY